MNTSEFLMISSAIVPDRPVMFFDDEAITFSEFQERVNKLANALSDQGVVAGDRVAMMRSTPLIVWKFTSPPPSWTPSTCPSTSGPSLKNWSRC